MVLLEVGWWTEDLEDLADVRLQVLALAAPLELVDLLHLQVFHGTYVLQQRQLGSRREAAERAVEDPGSVGGVEVSEEQIACLVSLAGRVQLQFVRGVGVVVTRVAADLDSAGGGDVLQLPLVARTSLLHVVHVLQPLQVLVSLAVQLEVCLQVRLVGAEFTDVVAGDHSQDLLFSDLRAVC